MKQTDNSVEQRLDKGVKTATLSAFYGGLLTDKQRLALRLHYEEDWSLGEIADELGVTRQNVHELITRSEQKLARYEQALGCAARADAIARQAAQARDALNAATALLSADTCTTQGAQALSAIGLATVILTDIIHQQEGEDDEHGV